MSPRTAAVGSTVYGTDGQAAAITLSGIDPSSEGETFEDWITYFKLVAEMHKWNSQAKLN